MYDAASIAIQSRGATVAEIRAHFPHKSKEQVQDALHNAANRKLVKCIRRGNQPAIWGPMDMPSIVRRPNAEPKRIVTSPFQPEGVEYPRAAGIEVHPLGGW